MKGNNRIIGRKDSRCRKSYLITRNGFLALTSQFLYNGLVISGVKFCTNKYLGHLRTEVHHFRIPLQCNN